MGKDEMFGWLKFELISSEDFQNELAEIQSQEQEYYKNRDTKQAEVLETIKKVEDDAREKALQKQKAEEEKKIKAKQDQEKAEAELFAMSPAEKIIDSYDNLALVVNAMKDGSIENFEEIKIELAEKIKEELQKNPKNWEKAKQKALKRKEYIESILG